MSEVSAKSDLIVAFYSASAVADGFGFSTARTPDGKEINYTMALDARNASLYTRSDKQVVYEGPKNQFEWFSRSERTQDTPDFDHLDPSLYIPTFAAIERGVRRQFGFEP